MCWVVMHVQSEYCLCKKPCISKIKKVQFWDAGDSWLNVCISMQYLAGVRLALKLVKSPAMQQYTDGILRYDKGWSKFLCQKMQNVVLVVCMNVSSRLIYSSCMLCCWTKYVLDVRWMFIIVHSPIRFIFHCLWYYLLPNLLLKSQCCQALCSTRRTFTSALSKDSCSLENYGVAGPMCVQPK